jgi:hypothetical protein
MLSNFIILLLKLSPHFVSLMSHYLICFLHYLSDMCLIRRSFTVFELIYLFYFSSFPVPLILFILPLSLIEQHHSRLLNIHFQVFLFHILSQVLHHFSFPFCHNYQVVRKRQTFFKISSISATCIVNLRGLSEQPCLTPFLVSNHSPSFSPTFTLFFVLVNIFSSYQPFAYSSLSLSLIHSNIFSVSTLSNVFLCFLVLP